MAFTGAITVTLKGQRKLQRALRRLPEQFAQRVMYKATGEATTDMAWQIKAAAPTDEFFRLVRSVVQYRWRNKSNPMRLGHNLKWSRKQFPKFYYAVAVEFGREGWPEGHPFIRPTLYRNANRARRVMFNRLRVELKRFRVL